MRKKAFSLIELSIVILIIGILVAGITQSSRLVTQYKLNAARTITQSSGVSSIKDLALWLEPLMENSITSATNGANPENGDAVSAWNDYNPQASQKFNLTQGTSGNRPTYVEKGIGGLPTLSFSGSHFIENTSGAPIPLGYKQYTLFIVWQQTSTTGVQVLLHQRGAQSCTTGDRAGFYTASGSLYGWGCGSDTTVSSYSVNKPYASVYRVDNTQANNVTIYLNGTKTGPTTTTLATLGATAFGVGYGNDNTNPYYYRGYISEVIVFARALKDEEITETRNYLKKKYGFAA